MIIKDYGSARNIATGLLDLKRCTIEMAYYTMIKEHKTAFRSACPDCKATTNGGGLHQIYWCDICKSKKDFGSLKKEYEGLNFSQEEVKLSTDSRIKILAVVPEAKIMALNRIRKTGKPYILGVKPDKKSKAVANKVYQTFKDWLCIGHLVALVRFSLRNREQIGILSPFVQDTLIVEPIFWTDEVVEIEDSEFSQSAIGDEEKAVAHRYFTSNFYRSELPDLSAFTDTQEETIKNIIKARAEGKTIEVVKTKAVKGENILDLFGDDLAEQVTEEKVKIPVAVTTK